MKIVTSFDYPPIPIRDFDWSAVDADTYDGEGCPIGHGRTEAAAIADLREQIEDRAAAPLPAPELFTLEYVDRDGNWVVGRQFQPMPRMVAVNIAADIDPSGLTVRACKARFALASAEG